MIFSLAISKGSALGIAFVATFLVLFMTLSSSGGIKALIRKNALYLTFAAVFTVFLIVSARIDGLLDWRTALLFFVKILIILNLVSSGLSWIGLPGFAFVVNHAPSGRVRLFLIFLRQTAQRLIANSRWTARVINTRMNIHGAGRILIARYYTRNFIMKELYSIHLAQASAVMRAHSGISVFVEKQIPARVDFAAFISTAISIILFIKMR
jgi:hypothetical protein